MRLIISTVLFFVAGIIQYADFKGGSIVNSEDLVLWNMDVEQAQATSGIFAYAKDFFCLVFGFYWPISVIKNGDSFTINLFLNKYIPWVIAVFCIGLIGYGYNSNPYQFILAGIRWLILFHAAFGFFLFALNAKVDSLDIHKYYLILPALCFLNCIYVFDQLNGAASFFGIGIGAARVMGLFSNAAVSAFFSLAIAFVFVFGTRYIGYIKLAVCLMCLYCGIGSGTRFIIICEVFLCLYVIFDIVEKLKGKIFAQQVLIYFSPIVFVVLYLGYEFLISSVDRGGIFEAARDSDGRFGRLIFGFGEIFSGDVIDLLFGGGIGVGTNTVYTMLSIAGYQPGSFKLNHLVDNGFLTIILQFGLIGAIVFFVGIIMVIINCFYFRNNNKIGLSVVCFCMFVTMFAGSPFDHYYLMVGFGLALGLSANPLLNNFRAPTVHKPA